MAIKTSTGLAAHLMVTGSAKAAFDGGFIHVYSGTEPASADDGIGGATEIWTISKDGAGTGLTFATAASGRSMVNTSGHVWAGATTAGTASFWRLTATGDVPADTSTSAKRIQGTCGSLAGADLYMTNTTLETNASLTAKSLAAFSVTLPTY